MTKPGLPILERLALHSVRQPAPTGIDGDCLVWTGSRTGNGYGQIKINHKLQLAHRAAWVARNGEIPAATPWVLHSCDNPPCYNVEHLFLGTRADNIADMITKGRQAKARNVGCPHGHPWNERNTLVSGAQRVCRTCNRDRSRDYQRRLREQRRLTRGAA